MTEAPEPAPAGDSGLALTEDGFLDQRLRIRQPRDGYRAAIDPVFKTSSITLLEAAPVVND